MAKLRIPYPTELAEARGITKQQWGVLVGTTFANTSQGDSILQAWDLAEMRGLDVFGGHVAIVRQSRYDKDAGGWVDYETCWLTVKALIYLAHKTECFAGIDEVKFGPMTERRFKGSKRNRAGQNESTEVVIEAPQYATATVYRFVKNDRCAFSDTVFFDEAVALTQGLPNAIWHKKPMLMLSKCAKVAALRLGFGECDFAAEEVEAQVGGTDLVASSSDQSQAPVTNPANENGPANQAAPIVAGTTAFDGAVDDFSKLPPDALRWLDRNLETAAELGAIDQTVDAMKETLDHSCHKLGEELLKSLSVISKDSRFRTMWKYILGARTHGGTAYEKAKGNFDKKAKAGEITEEISNAAATVLTFLQAAS